MKHQTFDVIVVGLGAMGSAAAYHLAKAGRRVLGLDRFRPPHTFGSSHGQTRIIREAYFEHPTYVPLVQRAYQLWDELSGEASRELLLKTGGLTIGAPDSIVVRGTKRSAEQHSLPHENLSAADVCRRFPALQPEDQMVAVWEPRAGILFLEACIEAHLQLAARHGAMFAFDEPVTRWEADGSGVRVFTAKEHYAAGHLVFTAGAWLTSLVPELKLLFQIERQVLHWFEPVANASWFRPDHCPIHLWEYEPERFFYGFPDLGSGVKIARHHEGESVSPDTVRREVRDDEVAAMRGLLKRFLPDAAGRALNSTVCVYTNTPDHHFFIDEHPAHRQVLIASPCSGHGFKFSAAIGEALAEWVATGKSKINLGFFRNRFDGSATTAPLA